MGSAMPSPANVTSDTLNPYKPGAHRKRRAETAGCRLPRTLEGHGVLIGSGDGVPGAPCAVASDWGLYRGKSPESQPSCCDATLHWQTLTSLASLGFL